MKDTARSNRARELKPADLAPRRVVLVETIPGQPIAMVISRIDWIQHTVSFYSPQMKWIVVHRYDQQGRFYSTAGRTVHIYDCGGQL